MTRLVPKLRSVFEAAAALALFLRKWGSGRGSRWISLLTLPVICAGCILGPPVEGEPQEELFPPYIVIDQVSPPPQRVLKVEKWDLCKTMQFKLGKVIDRNISDVLYVRWFLDWTGPGSMDGYIRNWSIPAGGSIERTSSWLEYDLDLSQSLDDGMTHSLTVVIADRALLETEAIGFPPTQDGSNGQAALFQWDFILESGGACTVLR